MAWRIKLAAESLGWDVFLDEQRGRNLKKKRGFDWVISISPQHKTYNKHCNNYVPLLHPFNYAEEKTNRSPFYERYKGYLLTINPGDDFKHFLSSKKKPLFSVPFYPTLQYVEYKKVPINNLVTMISVWGNRLKDEKFLHLYSLLSQSGFTKFYGINSNSAITEDSYLGKIPFDGTSVVEILQKHGITLIFHSDLHNREEIPSCRIFEAAAASTIIISDTNSFVKKHFGETVFYVDTSLSAEEVFAQIKNHMDAIHQNPEKALQMAKQAHQIFVDQFLMSDQLLNVMAMHREILKYEKAQAEPILLKMVIAPLSFLLIKSLFNIFHTEN